MERNEQSAEQSIAKKKSRGELERRVEQKEEVHFCLLY
jgi:hypothetical protein